MSMEDLVELLHSVDHEKVVSSTKDAVISDAALEALLDRTMNKDKPPPPPPLPSDRLSAGFRERETEEDSLKTAANSAAAAHAGVFKVIAERDSKGNLIAGDPNTGTQEETEKDLKEGDVGGGSPSLESAPGNRNKGGTSSADSTAKVGNLDDGRENAGSDQGKGSTSSVDSAAKVGNLDDGRENVSSDQGKGITSSADSTASQDSGKGNSSVPSRDQEGTGADSTGTSSTPSSFVEAAGADSPDSMEGGKQESSTTPGPLSSSHSVRSSSIASVSSSSGSGADDVDAGGVGSGGVVITESVVGVCTAVGGGGSGGVAGGGGGAADVSLQAGPVETS